MSLTRNKPLWFFIGCILLVVNLFLSSNVVGTTIPSLSVLGIIIIVYVYASWSTLYYRVLSPYIVFVVCLYLCLCGQSIMWAFGLEAGWRDLRASQSYGITDAAIKESLVYSYLCILILHLTVISKVKRTGHYNRNSLFDKYNGIDIKQNCNKLGWVLVIVSAIPYLYTTSIQMAVISSLGYAAQYTVSSNIPSWLAQFSDYICVGIIMLIYSTYEKKNSLERIIVFVIAALFILNELQLGQRTPLVLFAMAILFVAYRNKNIKGKSVIIGLALIFVGMTFMRAITLIRDGSIASIDEFSNYFNDSENIPAIDFLGDIGWNLFSLGHCIQLIPSKVGYNDGVSYIMSLTSIIPNLGFWDIHPAAKYCMLGNWLQEQLGLNYGPGFTPIAESYYNFGWYGFLVFVLWGNFCIFLNKLFESKDNNVSYLFLTLIIGVVFKSAVRSSFLAFFKPLVFFCILPLIVVVSISNKHNTSKHGV